MNTAPKDRIRLETEAAASLVGESPVVLSLDAEDVVLVSGGAKGITFELALELARYAKTNFALLGSSRPPGSDADPANDDVLRNLARLRQEGSRCIYVQADVTDLAAVRRAVTEAERELGAVTAIFHGAGITELRGIRDKPLEEFQRCIRIKARGLYNLLAVVPPARLKALHVISSVLGNSGMRGQVDYTFANAWLDGAVRSFKAAHPRCHCLSLGYSVWAGTGLGAKIGALESLRAVGVTPIEIERGVAAYRGLLRQPQAGTQFIITGRLTTDLEANLYSRPPAARGRFLEKVLRWIPGAEIIAEATLSHATDLYLPEHVFEGTPMFPGVMAIEAMVQAAMACASRSELPVLRNIAFRRPLIVPEEGVVVVRTLAFAEASNDATICVRVAMRSAGDDFQENHFEAECWFELGSAAVPPAQIGETRSDAGGTPALPGRMPPILDRNPEEFSPVPLFQGKFFRRITAVRRQEMEKESVTDLEVPQGEVYYGGDFTQTTATPSPALRDAFLQSGAIALPPGCLPVSISELRFHRPPHGRLHCRCNVRTTLPTSYVTDITILDPSGAAVETMKNLVMQAPKDRRQSRPKEAGRPTTTAQIFDHLRTLLPRGPHALVFVNHTEIESHRLPELSSGERERIAAENSEARRASAFANLVAARRAAVQFAREQRGNQLSAADIGLAQRADGKPELQTESLHGVDITLADNAGASVALVGLSPLGVDIESVSCRDCETWRGLLGMDGYTLALRVQRETHESFDCAATRVWTLLEAGKKAHSLRRSVPRFVRSLGNQWLSFRTEDSGIVGEFISVLLQHPVHGGAAALGLTLGTASEEPRGPHDRKRASEDLQFSRDYSGPRGQLVWTKRFSINFRACRTPSKKVDFTSYYEWLGDVREHLMLPITTELKELFREGKWGMSTNHHKLEVLDEIEPGETVETRIWQDSGNVVLGEPGIMKCDWRKIDGAGRKSRVAISEFGYSWVRIVGHGLAKAEPMPAAIKEFFNDMMPKRELSPRPLEELPSRLKHVQLGGLRWRNEHPLNWEPAVFSHELQTTSENSNWVGNVYFANYGEWMGRVRDLYFHRLTPDSFRNSGRDGEWVCLSCSIDHLTEAMPFDRIRIEMRVEAIYRSGVDLSFNYHLLAEDQVSRKLAHGKHRMAWVGRDARNEPIALDLPVNVSAALLEAASVGPRE